MKYCLVIFLFISIRLYGQDSNYIARSIQLDEVVINAVKGGFDINSFIKRVEDDTTFYKAFKTLRIIGYTASNDIKIFDKKGNTEASLKSITRQIRKNGCRSMEVLKENTTGNFYTKKKRYNYYTAELYAHLFFSDGVVCGEDNIVNGGKADTPDNNSTIEKHKEQLKKLIFNPGQPISGVPVVGKKVAIFDNEIAPLYNFSITSADYAGVPCYVFSAKAKPDHKKDVVIDSLVTYFSKSNFEIVERSYALSYKTWVFDFDVQMDVQMTKFNNQLIPSLITYHGVWNIPFHKRERADFTASFYDFTQDE